MGHAMIAGGNPAMKAPMTGILASDLAVGSIVKLMENGVAVEYLVVNQGKPSGSSLYDDSCDSTWLLRQDPIELSAWDNGNVNKLESSDIQAWLNGAMLGKYDANIQAVIKQVKIPYRKNGGSGGTNKSGANGLSCKVFLLSGCEVGFTVNESSYLPNDGAKLTYFESGNGSSAQQKRIAKLNGSVTSWWLRSPNTANADYVFFVNSNGDCYDNLANRSCGVRPALVLLTNAVFDDETLILKGVA